MNNDDMIRSQIIARGVRNPRVIAAMRSIPRELFVPPHLRPSAYEDGPLPIGHGQTISQPYIVAIMSELLGLHGHEKVLEIGAGSGYQTAVLARLARLVFSAELEPELANGVAARLRELRVANAIVGVGDGVEIFRDEAPFDAILSAAAPVHLPDRLIEQLADGGRCIIPIGGWDMQFLWLIEKRGGRVTKRRLEPVRFVPLRTQAAGP